MIQNCLFRYRSYNEFTLKEILYDELWFSSVENLNDPFEFPFFFNRDYKYDYWDLLRIYTECKIRTIDQIITLNKNDDLSPEKQLNLIDDLITELESNIRKDILESNVCCFTKKSNNSLMWSHYADGMRGLCIAYDQDLLSEANVTWEKIEYVNLIKKMHISDCRVEETDKSTNDHYHAKIIFDHNDLYKYSYFKHLNWKYEEEVRSVITKFDDKHIVNGQVWKIKENTIKGVIVGYKMPKYNMDIIRMICRNKNIPIYIAEPNLKNFTVSYKKIE